MAPYRYIAVQREAIDEIVSDRLLQSADFEPGQQLGGFLAGEDIDLSRLSPQLVVTPGASGAGVIITRAGSKSERFLVFDVDQTGLFGAESGHSDAVQSFQKTARFALKYWDKRILNAAEFVYHSYGKAVVFPYPISQKTRLRIVLDLSPDAERLRKRNHAGRYLLVYKYSADDGQGPRETASLTVFRKFLEDIERVELGAPAVEVEANPIAAFQNVTLGLPPGRMDIHQGFELWMRVLTTEQRRFVEGLQSAPVRIEGPAGTGKTLCLALKAVSSLRKAEEANEINNSLFVTHSEASRRSIVSVFQSMDAERYMTSASPKQALKITTLQELCSSILHQELSATELLDPDAFDAKQLQLLYVEAALRDATKELPTYEKFMSPSFLKYLRDENEWPIVQMIQHEIGVVIKGRANESYESYLRIPALKSGLPLSNEGDKGFLWRVYELYRDQLVTSAQFDTDDVMLSALGQLATPIWRRRRAREGFDFIYVDETHLFNMNELSIFHHLTKRDDVFPIAFAVDRSQAIGDRGWVDDVDVKTLLSEDQQRQITRTKMSTVFRCSPDIVNLAFSVTSAGANLFTNFEDPMSIAHSNLSFDEERICELPSYVSFENDEMLIDGAYDIAEQAAREMASSRGHIAIVAFTEELFSNLISKAEAEHRPVEILKERGNVEVVRKAINSGRFVLSMPDYVGGLEFDGVVLVGVDEGRVPPSSGISQESRAFLNFAAHNRLYVAITRARYRVVIAGVRSRGTSSVLASAFKMGAIKHQQ